MPFLTSQLDIVAKVLTIQSYMGTPERSEIESPFMRVSNFLYNSSAAQEELNLQCHAYRTLTVCTRM